MNRRITVRSAEECWEVVLPMFGFQAERVLCRRPSQQEAVAAALEYLKKRTSPQGYVGSVLTGESWAPWTARKGRV